MPADHVTLTHTHTRTHTHRALGHKGNNGTRLSSSLCGKVKLDRPRGRSLSLALLSLSDMNWCFSRNKGGGLLDAFQKGSRESEAVGDGLALGVGGLPLNFSEKNFSSRLANSRE